MRQLTTICRSPHTASEQAARSKSAVQWKSPALEGSSLTPTRLASFRIRRHCGGECEIDERLDRRDRARKLVVRCSTSFPTTKALLHLLVEGHIGAPESID